MANDLNQFTFTGRLGKDPIQKATASGLSVSTFSVAVGESRKDKNTNEWTESTSWFNAVCYDRVADKVNKSFKKGNKVLGVGKVTIRKYQDKSGIDKWSTEITVNRIDFIPEAQKVYDKPQAVQEEIAVEEELNDKIPF